MTAFECGEEKREAAEQVEAGSPDTLSISLYNSEFQVRLDCTRRLPAGALGTRRHRALSVHLLIKLTNLKGSILCYYDNNHLQEEGGDEIGEATASREGQGGEEAARGEDEAKRLGAEFRRGQSGEKIEEDGEVEEGEEIEEDVGDEQDTDGDDRGGREDTVLLEGRRQAGGHGWQDGPDTEIVVWKSRK